MPDETQVRARTFWNLVEDHSKSGHSVANRRDERVARERFEQQQRDARVGADEGSGLAKPDIMTTGSDGKRTRIGDGNAGRLDDVTPRPLVPWQVHIRSAHGVEPRGDDEHRGSEGEYGNGTTA